MDHKTKLFLSVLLEQQEPQRDNAGAYYPELRATTSGVQKVGSVSFKDSKEYIVSILRLDLKLLKDSTTFSANTIFPLYKIASEQESYNNIKTFLNDEKLANSIPAQNKFKEVFTDSGLNLSFNKTKVGDIFDEIGKLYEGEDKNPQEDFEKLRNNFANLLKSINTGDINDSNKIRNAIVTQIQNTILANKDALRSNGPTIRKFNDFISPKFTSSKPGEVKVVTTTDDQEDEQTAAQDPETGNTATVLDGTAKFITMLEFLQARKEQEERLTGTIDRNDLSKLGKLNEQKGFTTRFISAIYKTFKRFLEGIFTTDKELNNQIKEQRATKTFLNSAKERIYTSNENLSEQIGQWTQQEFSDAVNEFFDKYDKFGGIMEEIRQKFANKGTLKPIADSILKYYKSGGNSEIVTGLQVDDFSFADTPKKQEELVDAVSSDDASAPQEKEEEALSFFDVDESVRVVAFMIILDAKKSISYLRKFHEKYPQNPLNPNRKKSFFSRIIYRINPYYVPEISQRFIEYTKELNDILSEYNFEFTNYLNYSKADPESCKNLIIKLQNLNRESPDIIEKLYRILDDIDSSINVSYDNDLEERDEEGNIITKFNDKDSNLAIEETKALLNSVYKEFNSVYKETINLQDKSSRTSKLIVESITKSKTIKVKGTKEQINLFNKLIKEELSIISKIKNNKPYIIPTKDIENFERLTGIVWPFKEGN
jgi:hypothetical protein